jgi:hypothetical protein
MMQVFVPEMGALSSEIKLFFQLSSALALSEAEERALLDVSLTEVRQMRNGGPHVIRTGGDAKLERRVNYAIPILRRMLAAAS